MAYPLYLFFAFLPSFVWLLFFLRKDSHPESNPMIIRVFFLGMLIALPAAGLEILFFQLSEKLNLSITLAAILNTFLGVALIEETLKYFVVKGAVINNPELDEPIDVVLYMIIAALGFAALENILILTPLAKGFFLARAFEISVFRFLGATFLHALASGVLGYFLALSFLETKKRRGLLALGFSLAILSHGLYNFSILNPTLTIKPLTAIMRTEGSFGLLIPLIVLLGLAVFLISRFKRLQKLKSVCKIEI